MNTGLMDILSHPGKGLNPIKKQIKDMARVRLNSDLGARAEQRQFHHTGWNACADLGLCSLAVPVEEGGKGLTPLETAVVLETLGYECHDNGLINALHAHNWGCTMVILNHGSRLQKDRYLNRLCSGTLIGASAMTEPESGSNVYGLQTTAVRQKKHYRLDGSKIFVTNGSIADIFVVYARTGDGGFSGLSAFIVEKGRSGLHVSQDLSRMSLTTGPVSELSLINCVVPEKNRIGAEGGGGMIFADSIEWERTFVLATAVGVMERHLDICLKRMDTSRTRMSLECDGQHRRRLIADMKIRLESSRMLVYKAAWRRQKDRNAYLDATLAKVAVSEAFVANCRDAVSVYGPCEDDTFKTLLRDLYDARAGTVYSGTTEVLKDNIAKLLD